MIRMVILIMILMLAGAANAQINHPYNEVGIYTVEQPDGCAAAQIDVPVFAINWDGEMSFCETVPTRDASFGEVKALFR